MRDGDCLSASTASGALFDIHANLDFAIKVEVRDGYEYSYEDHQCYRFQLAVNPQSGDVSLQKLLDLLQEESGVRLSGTLKYEDEEEEEISINSTRALLDGIIQFIPKSCLRLIANEVDDETAFVRRDETGGEPEAAGVCKIRQLMRGSPRDPVYCNGILFDRRDVLEHLIFRFKDHATETFAPLCVEVDGNSDRKHWMYNISGRKVISEWLAIDGVYLDLLEEQLEGSYNLLVPRHTYEKLTTAAHVRCLYLHDRTLANDGYPCQPLTTHCNRGSYGLGELLSHGTPPTPEHFMEKPCLDAYTYLIL